MYFSKKAKFINKECISMKNSTSAFRKFGVMIDCSRNAVMSVDATKRFITVLKKMGYNQVQLYMEDTYEVDGDVFECNLTFGDRTHLVELPLLSHGDISVSFGELTVDLSGCGMIAPDCSIDASCSFGQLNLLVPRKYLIEADSSTAFAAYEVKGHPDSIPEARIRLDASVSFGAITVQYI